MSEYKLSNYVLLSFYFILIILMNILLIINPLVLSLAEFIWMHIHKELFTHLKKSFNLLKQKS